MNRSIIIPAHNEESTICSVIDHVRLSADEIIVVASACKDRTVHLSKERGVKVIEEHRPGKHYAIRAGLELARGKHVVFLDADLESPVVGIAELLFEGLKNDVVLAKGYYQRESDGEGRLTEICARPLLNLMIPELAHVRDPLVGEFAVVRESAIKWPLAPGYAVDLGFLICASRTGGYVEVNLGKKVHKHRSVHALGCAAVQVAATIINNATSPSGAQSTEMQNSHFRQYENGTCNEQKVDLVFLPPITLETACTSDI